MSQKINRPDAATGYDNDLSAGASLERQILLDLLATTVRFGLVVTAVVLAVEALSLG